MNEYNYLEDWSEGFVSSIKNIISIKGAAFTSAVMAVGQQAGLDMLITSTMKENIVTIKDGRIELKINPQSVILLEKE